MSTVRTFVRATAVVAGSSAALLFGGLMGTAHADPAPVPSPDISQQLVGTAAQAPQLLQSVAGALGGQPATPPPLASASIKMPQTPAAATPGALTSLLGGGSPLSSGLASAAGLPATAAAPAATLPLATAPVVPATATNPLLFPVSALP